MKILLTGANGNFGQQFLLQATHEVVSVNRGDWGDLDELMAGVDVVIHAASDLHAPLFEAPARWINSNIVSTGAILEAAKRAGVNQFLFTSSCAVYGDSAKTNEFGECRPKSANGVSKYLNELLIEEFCARNKIKLNMVRIFNMFGGQDNFSILSHVRGALKRNVPFVLNNSGIAQRDFVHVRDVVSIVNTILETGCSHTKINIGTGRTTRISTIIDAILARFPELKIEHAEAVEAEYSRADITLLRTLTDHRFIDVRDYLNDEFNIAGGR